MHSFIARCSLRQAHAKENVRLCAHFLKALKGLNKLIKLLALFTGYYIKISRA